MDQNDKEGMMQRETYNQQLLQGLLKIRNRDDLSGVRHWIRQCISLERKRQWVNR